MRSVADGVRGVIGDGPGAHIDDDDDDDDDDELELSLTICLISNCATLDAKSCMTCINSPILVFSCWCGVEVLTHEVLTHVSSHSHGLESPFKAGAWMVGYSDV